ncbi:MAG: ATP-binding protein, partial [Saprospiraceae bacterium]
KLIRPAEAKKYLDAGLSLSREIGFKKGIQDAYQVLTDLDSSIGNYNLALEHYKLYTLYKDSLFNESNSKTIADMKTKYETEKKDKEIQQLESDKQISSLELLVQQESLNRIQTEKAKIQTENLYNLQQVELLGNEQKLQQLEIEKNQADLIAQKAETDRKQDQVVILNKDGEIQKLEIKKQTLFRNYLIGGLILFGFLSFFVYKNYSTRQKLKLQTLRNKIASDLHDDVGSTLSSISIFSQIAQEQSKEVIPLLETIGESSRKMLDAMADIVWTINPENDQFEKIILRMRGFAYELLGAKGMDFEFVADEELAKLKLPMEVRKNLYLIFKEATNNMVKYAGASKAMFTIKEEKDNLIMMIRDNGQGYDMNKLTEGNGIKNMKKRAEEIGAKLLIESFPGSGTTIRLKIAV